MNKEYTKNPLLNELIDRFDDFLEFEIDNDLPKELEDSFSDGYKKVQEVIDKMYYEQIRKEFHEVADKFMEDYESGRWPNIKKFHFIIEGDESIPYFTENEDPYINLSFTSNGIPMTVTIFFHHLGVHPALFSEEDNHDSIAISKYKDDGDIEIDMEWSSKMIHVLRIAKTDDMNYISKDIVFPESVSEFYRVLDELEKEMGETV